jgi:hypothetical protein
LRTTVLDKFLKTRVIYIILKQNKDSEKTTERSLILKDQFAPLLSLRM